MMLLIRQIQIKWHSSVPISVWGICGIISSFYLIHKKKLKTFKVDYTTGKSSLIEDDKTLSEETRSYYQLASYLYQKKLYQH